MDEAFRDRNHKHGGEVMGHGPMWFIPSTVKRNVLAAGRNPDTIAYYDQIFRSVEAGSRLTHSDTLAIVLVQ